MAELTLKTLHHFYEQLWRIRLLEGQVQRLAAAGEVPGFPHLSTGQEAVAVGVCANLSAGDYLFSGHRAHGHVIAKGSDPFAVFAEIIGRDTGLCRGRGGSMHLVDAANGVLGATGVVAGNLPLAAGAAWAAQVQGEGRIAAVFFGDGATGAGVFHETLNMASLWNLPLLLVCENNGYAEFTSREEHSKVGKVSAFAAPYGISAQTVDGNDVLAVHDAAQKAVAQVRGQGGPWLLECMTFRMAGHYVGDAQRYRSKEELAAVREKDPIERLQRHLVGKGTPQGELEAIAARVKEEMAAVVERARRAPRPDPASVMDYVSSAVLPQQA
ncbi:MAG: thiamine pyrophosphate-dependent dehydrogenase E1 component subunit alpha [Betaproteobacteria bacterium]|nr:thiamine pyrophosphate-dependent dehydrogenase E1 component subunit alpha [Betaproteobacteria bacterium]MBI2960662.1 thiamine pyrophosphate-dependent dehydrogenase E1 component subunit alpha [Betaproteobacteria bacterium]